MAGFVAVPARYNPAQSFEPAGRGLAGPVGQRYGAPQVGLSAETGTLYGSWAPLLGDQLVSGPGGALHYARRYYPNVGGRRWDEPATTFSPGYNETLSAGRPSSPPPAGAKRYDQWTERRWAGSWGQSFPAGNGIYVRWVPVPGQAWRARYEPTGVPQQLAAPPRRRPQSPQRVLLRFFGVQPQMDAGQSNLLTSVAPAGSYGQWTTVLGSVPAGQEPVYG